MADLKISELPAATTPLAGTEVVPIVQGGTTKNVPVSEIGGSGGNSRERAFVTPTLTDFAWINQDTAVATQRDYGIGVVKPRGSGLSISLLKRAAPSTPYTISAAFSVVLARSGNYEIELGFRNSSSGLLQHVTFAANGINNDWVTSIQNWNSATSYNAAVQAARAISPLATVWLQIADDGTDRSYRYSSNGDDWSQIYTIGRTSFLTPDEVFFGILTDSTDANALPSNITLLSWEVA